MSTVGLNVRVYVNELGLTALLWNRLVRKHGGAEEATEALAARTPSLALVRELVRREVADYGIESVNCGPTVDYYAPAVERMLASLVSRAF
jgi:hypothetical protein